MILRMKLETAIIPVAGFGSRLLPATKVIPKAMLPVGGKPILDHLVDEAVASGMRHIVIVCGSGIGKEIIKRNFIRNRELENSLRLNSRFDLLSELLRSQRKGIRFTFITQPRAIGNADAVLRALRVMRTRAPVAVLFGDDIVDSREPATKQLFRVFAQKKCPVVAVAHISKQHLHRYGAIVGKRVAPRTYRIMRVIEKPKGRDLRVVHSSAIIGRYILPADALSHLRELLRLHRGPEASITDLLPIYMKTSEVLGVEIRGTWYDCGSREGYLHANLALDKKATFGRGSSPN